MKIILQKIIAASGLASRRGAEKMIREGRVRVNGVKAQIGDSADEEADMITVSGRPLPRKAAKIYLKLNKPAGYTCTNRSFAKERNIYELVPSSERLFAIGRLDKDSRGLLLLTNDGDLAQRLAHPRFQHEKIYLVRTKDAAERPDKIVSALLRGLDIGEGDGKVRAQAARYLQNDSFVITLNEGKKRQLRRMFRNLGLEVSDLQRIGFAGLELGGLPEGSCRKLSAEELTSLRGRAQTTASGRLTGETKRTRRGD